ncbi:unnamed protein product, partial [Ectocarpus sp. 12 AP-2014]
DDTRIPTLENTTQRINIVDIAPGALYSADTVVEMQIQSSRSCCSCAPGAMTPMGAKSTMRATTNLGRAVRNKRYCSEKHCQATLFILLLIQLRSRGRQKRGQY